MANRNRNPSEQSRKKIKRRSSQDQQFWDAVFLQQLPDCTRSQKQRGPQYCAHVAREYADAALTERRRSQQGGQQ